jgi:DNA-directed RNA polymerase beta' subunit
MRLQLLDIERFIQKNDYKEVKNAKVTPKGFDPESLWSENIFGTIGSKDRRSRYGYIQFKYKLIHPNTFNILKVCSEATSKIINKKANFIVSKKMYIEDPAGETGIPFLIRTLSDVDLQLICKKEKLESASFIESNKNNILIDKFMVIPAGYRDIDLSKKDAIQMSSEVNNMYKDLLYINNHLSGDPFLDEILIEKLQFSLNRLATWFQHQLKGKKGILRGSMLKKRLDYTSRLVCITNQEIPLGYVGLPWHTALAIFEPLFTHYCYKKDPSVLEDIKIFLNNPNLDFNDFSKFIQDFTAHPQIVPPELQQKLEFIASEVIKDQVVMFKRDPITHRNGWTSAHPIITKGRVVQVCALDIIPLQGDFDGDTIAIVPLFSDEAKREANEKINPLYSKSKWSDIQNNNKIIFTFSLDILATIYRATADAK